MTNWKEHFIIADEVKEALKENKPVVALETSIISHGMPYPTNLEMAGMVESIIRENGAIPATIGICKGNIIVGMKKEEYYHLANCKDKPETKAMKASLKGIPMAVTHGLNAGFTIAGIIRCASMAGIHVMATGGLGGVSRGGELSMDVSADLQELSKSNVAVVSAGIKPILDIARTKEVLETLDVPVLTRLVDCLPAFFSRTSPYRADYRIDDYKDIAEFCKAKWDLGLNGGVLIANPIDEKLSLDFNEIEKIIERAVDDAKKDGIVGEANTPYLLADVVKYTQGKSLEVNVEIVKNNAKAAAELAKAYAEVCK